LNNLLQDLNQHECTRAPTNTDYQNNATSQSRNGLAESQVIRRSGVVNDPRKLSKENLWDKMDQNNDKIKEEPE